MTSGRPDYHPDVATSAKQDLQLAILAAIMVKTDDIPSDPATGAKQDDIIAALGTGMVVSDNLRVSSDAEVSKAGSGYSVKKKIGVNIDGFWRVKFDLKAYENGVTYPNNALGKIYKNGVAYGTQRSNGTLDYVTYSEDLWFSDGDTVELWLNSSEAMGGAKAENFRLYGDYGLNYGSDIT